MSILGKLAACEGTWQGTNRLQDPHTNAPDDSPASATITPVLGGRFVRLDYTWGYQGTPQEGSLLIGYDKKTSTFTAHWIDTWHMSDKVMACQGAADENGVISVRGSYAAPPGPDWAWRTTISADPHGTLRMVMYNISPEGQEDLAVEASYTRV